MQFARRHDFTQPWQGDSQHHTSKVLRLPGKMTTRSPKCCVCYENATHLLKTLQKYSACQTKRLLTRFETVAMPQTRCHAYHTKRRYTTFEISTMTTFAALPIGRAIGTSNERRWTAAQGGATSSENTLNPQTARVKRVPLLRNWERGMYQRRFNRQNWWFSVRIEDWPPAYCHHEDREID